METEENRDQQPWNFHTCKFCGYRSRSTFLMCKHVRLHQNKSKENVFSCDSKTLEVFECETCEFDTNLKVDLYEHVRIFHEEKEINANLEDILKSFACRNCHFRTYSVLVLTEHVFKSCNVLHTSLRRKGNLLNSCRLEKQHLYQTRSKDCSKTNEHVNWFQYEQYSFETRTGASFKDRRCLLQTKCHVCVKNNAANSGIKSKECVKRFKCEQCPFQTRWRTSLEYHTFVKHVCAEKKTWFKSGQCPFQKKWESYSKLHSFIKHGILKDENKRRNLSNINWFECEQCPFKAYQKGNLKTHILIKHSNLEDINWFGCPQCPYKTKQKGSLKTHIVNKHLPPEEIKWFECRQCPFKAKQKGNLKTHILKKHLSVEVKDNAPKGGIKNKENVKRRKSLKYHTFVKHDACAEEGTLFKCGQCLFQTKWKGYLKLHSFVKHGTPKDGSKPSGNSPNPHWFECEQCPFKAYQKGNLKTHILIKHSNLEDINWFECVQCPFKTKQKGILKTHISNKHLQPEEIKWFECEQCPYKAKQKGNLKTHTLKKHLNSQQFL